MLEYNATDEFVEFPWKNTTAIVDIVEYQTCVPIPFFFFLLSSRLCSIAMTKHTMAAISAKDAISPCPMADNMKNTTKATIPPIMSWLCDFIFYLHSAFT